MWGGSFVSLLKKKNLNPAFLITVGMFSTPVKQNTKYIYYRINYIQYLPYIQDIIQLPSYMLLKSWAHRRKFIRWAYTIFSIRYRQPSHWVFRGSIPSAHAFGPLTRLSTLKPLGYPIGSETSYGRLAKPYPVGITPTTYSNIAQPHCQASFGNPWDRKEPLFREALLIEIQLSLLG